MCAELGDRGACEAAAAYPEDDAAVFGNCFWETWASGQLAEDGTCTFGTPSAGCRADFGSTVGCAGPSVACWADKNTAGASGAWRDGEKTLELGSGQVCTGLGDTELCIVDADGEVSGGKPECACLCDSAWPG